MTNEQIAKLLEKAAIDIYIARENLFNYGSNVAMIHVSRARVWLSQAETELVNKL